jgi:hypothetical protein
LVLETPTTATTAGETLYKLALSDARGAFQTYEIGKNAEDARRISAARRHLSVEAVTIVRDADGAPVTVVEPADRAARRDWLLAMYNADGSAK